MALGEIQDYGDPEQTLEDVEFEHEFAQGYHEEPDEGEDGFLYEQQLPEQQTNAIAEGDSQAWAAG